MLLRFRISRMAVVALLLICTTIPAMAGMITTSTNMPPEGGMYVGTGMITFPMGVFMRNITLSHFSASYPPPPPGNVVVHSFSARLDADLSIDGGQAWNPATGVGPETVQTVGNLDGTFGEEMTSYNVNVGTLFGPLLMRESPIRASTGQTTVESLGGDDYRIDSFFDVWFEVSLDGGMTWYQSDGSTRVELTPEPSAFLVLSAGLLGLAGIRRRKR